MKIGTAFSFWAFCCAFSLILFLTTQPSLAQGAINDEVEIQILGKSRVLVDAGVQTPLVQSVDQIGDVSLTLDGTEKSECRPYGRASASRASASTRIIESSPNRVVVELSSSSYAQGGHFRTCPGGCFLGNCVGNEGNDTASRSEGRALSTIRVKIHSFDASETFLLDVGTVAQAGNIVVHVKTPSGNDVPRSSEKGNEYLLSADTHEAVLFAEVQTSAQNKGGCCNHSDGATGLVSVSVDRPPVLYSAYQKGLDMPFIHKGEETHAYRNVAAIGLNGLIHCSGTLIGRRTVLTAAHCVENYQNYIAAGRMTVSFGSLFFRPEKNYVVTGFDFPRDPAAGFFFNPQTYEDDIAVLYVAEDVDSAYPPSSLHVGDRPTWAEIKDKPIAIIIVGFGFNVVRNDAVGAGIKREAAIHADGYTNRSFFFQRSNPNTCKGDSGGPSFLIVNDDFVLIGVTSTGDAGCNQGNNLRVDSYLPWLTTRIR